MKAITLSLIVFLALAVGFLAATLRNRVLRAGNQRKYYLTRVQVTGSKALSACAAGYHMASLWEIVDTTALQYDTALGVTVPDSGSGPPTDASDGFGFVSAFGWVRTGSSSATNGQNAGLSNCTAWTSDSASDDGSSVGLYPVWQVDAKDPARLTIAPAWRAERNAQTVSPPKCSVPHHVWCAQD